MGLPEIEWEQDDYSDILRKDDRFDSRAYDFVMQVLEEACHYEDGSNASGAEVLTKFRELALDAFGPLAYAVLADWGVTCCEDVGEIVYNLCDTKRIDKCDNDSRADFIGGFDFKTEFLEPYG